MRWILARRSSGRCTFPSSCTVSPMARSQADRPQFRVALQTVMSRRDLGVAPGVKILDGDSTLHLDIVMVVIPGQCMARLDLGTKCQGMISSVRTFGQAGTYRPVFSSSVLRSHDSDQVGRAVFSPTQECSTGAPETRVESSGIELVGGRQYRLSSGRHWVDCGVDFAGRGTRCVFHTLSQ